MSVKVQFQKTSPRAVLPKQTTAGAAGFDVHSTNEEPVLIMPHTTQLFPLGFKVAIQEGYEIQVRPRSGLALKEAISVANSPGTIDSDYRGECGVILVNIGNEPYTVRPGDRIAQFVVAAVPVVEFEEVKQLDETDRGEGGFGSTGK